MEEAPAADEDNTDDDEPPAKKPTPKKAAPAAAPEGEGRARRERKTVQHFQVAAPKKDDGPVTFEGKGTKLRDIPNGKNHN